MLESTAFVSKTPESGDEWYHSCQTTKWSGKLLNMRIQHLNHSTYQLQYHIVWGTRGRRNILQKYVKPELVRSLYETVKKYPTLHLETINTDQDHVHIQIEIPPNICISDAVQRLKANSSFHLRKTFKFIREIYLEKDGIWSVGYFVSSVGLNEEQIKRYIEWQGKKEVPRTISIFSMFNKKQS